MELPLKFLYVILVILFIFEQALTHNMDAMHCREHAKTRRMSRETVVRDGK